MLESDSDSEDLELKEVEDTTASTSRGGDTYVDSDSESYASSLSSSSSSRRHKTEQLRSSCAKWRDEALKLRQWKKEVCELDLRLLRLRGCRCVHLTERVESLNAKNRALERENQQLRQQIHEHVSAFEQLR